MQERVKRWGPIALLVLAVLLPLVPMLLLALRTPIGGFQLVGDYAALEVNTRLLATGRTLLGPYSRFFVNHPGPLYFATLAPVYAAMRGSSQALFVAPVVVAGASMAAIVASLARAASFAHALGAALVLVLWSASFADLVTVPWNPIVVALPLLAFVTMAALSAAGRAWAAVPAAFFASFCAQTHLSTLPIVTVTSALALGALALARRARRDSAPLASARLPLAAAAALALLLWIPALVEQALPEGGNLGKLARLFLDRPEPLRSWREAATQLAQVSTWVPRRLAEGALPVEGWEPEPMNSAAWTSLPAPLWTGVATVTFAAAAAAALVARRRRDDVSFALLALALAGAFVTLASFRSIIGPPLRYVVFWGTTASVVAWIGIATTATSWLASRGPRVVSAAIAACACALVALALLTTSAAQRSATHRGLGIPADDVALARVHDALVARLDRERAVAVMHGGPGFRLGVSLTLAFVRAGRPIRVEPYERWLLGRQFDAPHPGERVLHVWADQPPFGLELAPCTELLAREATVSLHVAPQDVRSCASP